LPVDIVEVAANDCSNCAAKVSPAKMSQLVWIVNRIVDHKFELLSENLSPCML
jgi:hypothetical protein